VSAHAERIRTRVKPDKTDFESRRLRLPGRLSLDSFFIVLISRSARLLKPAKVSSLVAAAIDFFGGETYCGDSPRPFRVVVARSSRAPPRVFRGDLVHLPVTVHNERVIQAQLKNCPDIRQIWSDINIRPIQSLFKWGRFTLWYWPPLRVRLLPANRLEHTANAMIGRPDRDPHR